MAAVIKLKTGSGAPTGGDLAIGEPALDLTNGKLYTSTTGSDILEISSYSLPSNPSFTNVTEGVYSLSGTTLDPDNGTMQYKVLSANTTFTDSLSSGQSMVLRLSNISGYTVTWPTIKWVSPAGNVAPTLGNGNVIVLWKEGIFLYGSFVGTH